MIASWGTVVWFQVAQKEQVCSQPPVLSPGVLQGFPGALVVKNTPASAGDARDMGSLPESGRPPGGEHGSPLQYSCLENPMHREAWWATVYAWGLKELDMTEQLTQLL